MSVGKNVSRVIESESGSGSVTYKLRYGSYPVVGFCLIHFHNDLVPLAHTNGDVISYIWLNRDEIGRDYRQGMIVNHKLEVAVNSSIYQSKEVCVSFQ